MPDVGARERRHSYIGVAQLQERLRRGSTGAAYIPGDVCSYIEDEDDPDYEFPLWWFFVIPSQFYLVWVFENCLWAIVFPSMLAEMYGDDDKAFVLAVTGAIGTVMGFAGPFIGSFSDRLPEMFPKFAARWGRRRPLYWAGQFIGVTSMYFTRVACDAGVAERRAGASHVSNWATALLLCSMGLSNFCWQFTSPTYGSIIPETVPQSQRGLCTAINAWISQVFLIAGAGCGILVGEGHISDELVWDLAILCAYMQVPLATWAFSGKACAPWKAVLYPFLWSNDAKERMPSKRQLAEKAAQTKRELKGFALTKGCDVFAREVREFFSPFKTPAYRYLWIQSFVGTIGGIIQGAFSFYWFQDCFTDGYYFFGLKAASSVQSAFSVNNLVGSIVNSCTSWTGNYWREKCGGRQIVLGVGPWGLTGILGFFCPFSYVVFSQSSPWWSPKILFTVVIFWTVWGNLWGGFASAGGGSLGPDVLPIGSDGRPSNAGRDSQLQGWAGRVPNVFLPMALGGAIKWFPSHLVAFNTFYIVGGTISVISWWMLALAVHPPNEKPGLHWQCTRHWCHGDDDPWYGRGGVREGQVNPRLAAKASHADNGGPRAAHACDELLFGKGVHSLLCEQMYSAGHEPKALSVNKF